MTQQEIANDSRLLVAAAPETIVAEPLRISGQAKETRLMAVRRALVELGLDSSDDFLHRYPRTLSGGQRQRVALARTLVARPELIIADEPPSMLDAPLRSSVTEGLMKVRDELGSTLVSITHDFWLAHLADRVIVLHKGVVVEDGPIERVLNEPRHVETRRLVDAARLVRVDKGLHRQ